MRKGRNQNGGSGRREPSFGPVRPGPEDIRAYPEDRAGGGRPSSRSGGERVEPVLGARRGRLDDLDPMNDGRDARSRSGKPGSRKVKPSASKRSGQRQRSLLGRLAYWAFVLGLWVCLGGAGMVAYYASQLPPIDQLAVPKRPPNIAIVGDDGTQLVNRGDTGGAAVRLRDLPPFLPKAFVAIEDRRFYQHWGIDPIGIVRAILRNATGSGGMQGGSTLTQQLAKNLFLTQERTVSRKIQEAILAIWLEHKYSKDQILELYLNRVYFGSGAYGVEAAANRYFGKSARTVTLAEAAVLAGLMKAPTKLAPNRNPAGATERAAQVVAAMTQEGFVNDAAAKGALANPAKAMKEHAAGAVNYAADYVMDMLDDTIGAVEEDIVVTTTISPSLETAGEHALDDGLNKSGGKFGVSQGALVSLDPDGAIKALVGGRDYADSQFDRAVSAKRQPGSAFKPFVYLSAIERGLTPDTVRDDAPINVKGWQPENYSREYFGPVTLTKALSLSLNTVAVRLGLEVGPRTVVKTAHRLGITSDLQPNASIALGTSEVTPLELAVGYAPFANGGIGVQPHIITRVKTTGGKLLYQRKGSSFGRVVDLQNVAMMNVMMQETLLTGTARKAELPGWQAAGKTGTSQDWRDAWFVGYTSRAITAVWLGNDDGSPTKKASGGNLPVEVWSRFMSVAHRGLQPQPLPGVWRSPTQDNPPDPTPMASLPPRDPGTGRSTIVAQQPSGWDSPPAPAAPAPQPMAPAAPMPLNVIVRARQADAGGGAPEATSPLPTTPGRLLPPMSIPDGNDAAPPHEKNILEQLFGG